MKLSPYCTSWVKSRWALVDFLGQRLGRNLGVGEATGFRLLGPEQEESRARDSSLKARASRTSLYKLYLIK